MQEPVYILSMTADQLTEAFADRYEKGAYHARATYRWVMASGSTDISHLPEFEKSQKLAAQVMPDLILQLPECIRTENENGTVKLALRLDDGNVIESVILPMKTYNTLCISTQVGCRMGCAFCETGRMGLIRNLLPHEIVGQLFLARHLLGYSIKNIVFMGMGEPFDNTSHLFSAIEILNDQRGLDVALSHMTISTVGQPEGILQLGHSQFRRIHLAVSVNAPDDTIRNKLMPINRRYPMAKLKQALLDFPLRPGGSFLIEYVLIPGVNNSASHAEKLAEYVADIPVRVNVIPHNPIKGMPWRAPTDKEVHRFSDALTAHGAFVRNRWEKGRGLSAACGQLGREIMAFKNKDQGKKV